MRLRAIAALTAMTLACGLTPARPNQEAGPEATVRSFIEHIEKGNMPAAAVLVEGSRKEQSYMFQGADGPHYVVKAVRVYGEGDEAIVVVDLEGTIGGQSKAMTDTFRLRKSDGVWKIQPQTIMEVVPAPSLLAGMMAPNSVFSQAKEAAKRTACLSNVKQLALATIMYAADHDDRFPDANNWRKSISPYTKSADIFRCPEDKSSAPTSYRMNALLSRVSEMAIDDPAGTVLIFEGDGDGFIPRHAARGNVAFADGHAKGVDAAQYPKLRKKR